MARQKFTPEDYDRLRRAGCPVLLPMDALNAPKLEISQAGYCYIEEIGSGITFVFDLALCVHSPCRIDCFGLMLPEWSPQLFTWVGPNEVHSYKGFPEFPADQFLNPLADEHKKLETGMLLDGVLLGFAPGRIPQHCSSPYFAIISLYDTSGACTRMTCETLLHRGQVSQRPAKKREPLFDGETVLEQIGQPTSPMNGESLRATDDSDNLNSETE